MKRGSKRSCAIVSSIAFVCAILAMQGLGAGASASPSITLLGEMSRQYTVAPGERISGQFALHNNGASPGSVRLYQTDYSFNADGFSYYDKPGLLPRSNAKWIQVGNNLVTVPSQASLKIPFQIAVPKDQTLIGSYWSVIMVEPVVKRDPSTGGSHPQQPEKQVSFGMGMEMRYAVQIVTNIGRTGQYKLSFTQPKLVKNDKGFDFQLDLINNGECWLSPMVWVDLYNGKGAPAGKFKGGKLRIYPGCSVRQRIQLPILSPGSYQALVIADNGDKNVFGTRYTLKVAAF